jgi:hypothetical protein
MFRRVLLQDPYRVRGNMFWPLHTVGFARHRRHGNFGAVCDEARLRWYFEEHLRFPFTQPVRAREAAESLITDGEALCMQVFKSTPEISVASQTAVRAGLQTLHLDLGRGTARR